MHTQLRAAFLGLVSLYWLIPSPAAAEVLALSHDDAADSMTLRDTVSGATSTQAVPGCCEIAAGTVTVDTAGKRAFFISQTPSASELVTFNYATGSSSRVLVTAGYRVTHMEHDPIGARLLALARDQVTEQIVMASINPATAVLTVRAALAAPCCELRTGVSALQLSGGTRFFAVGGAGAATEQLLVFNFDNNTGPVAVNIPNNLQLNDLAINLATNAIVGLAYDLTALMSMPINVGAAPGYAISTIGAGNAGCCYALAGAAAVDRIGNRIVVIGSAEGTSAPRVQSFSLVDGSLAAGIALPANALFEDFAIVIDVLFSDGFE